MELFSIRIRRTFQLVSTAVEFANILVAASCCPFIEFVGIFIHVLIELV